MSHLMSETIQDKLLVSVDLKSHMVCRNVPLPVTWSDLQRSFQQL